LLEQKRTGEKMPYRKLPDGRLEALKRTPEEVLESIKKEKVKFVELQLTDLPGRFHCSTVPAHTVNLDTFEIGVPKLDGSSIKGFVEIQESDMVLKPDPSTFAVIPWTVEGIKTARMISDVYWGYELGRLSRDPRAIAQKAEEVIRDSEYDLAYLGAEIEFFVFDKVIFNSTEPYAQSYRIESKEAEWSSTGLEHPIRFKEGYAKTSPQDTLAEYRAECIRILEDDFGVLCGFHGHEVGTAGQVEINMFHDTLTNMADGVMTYKLVAKSVARQRGMVATMMPKPIFLENASGMHTHVSLWKRGKNLFYDPDDPYAELSQLGRYFGGGLMEHSRSLAAIVAPTTNSYRRLVPGYEAPVYIAWSRRNRSANVRIPVYHKGPKGAKDKRIEFRTPDPSCNPYLSFAAIIAAGLDGIKKKTDIGDPIDEDIYKLTPERRKQLGIRELPGSLKEACEEIEGDQEYLKPIFTQDAIDKIIELGMKDHAEVSMRPHPYEFHLYFDI